MLNCPRVSFLMVLSCGETQIAIGQIFSYFWFVFWLVSFCQRYFRFFFRCLLPAGCRFLTGLCLASYRGVGVGCEAPHLRSISPKFPHGFCALLISYASASIYEPPGSACVMVSPFPSIVEEALFLRERGIIARSLRAHLSGAF